MALHPGIKLLDPVRSAALGTVPAEGETFVQKLMPTSRADYIIDGNGCWIWQKYLDPKGYPMTGQRKAHHVYWELATGQSVPKGWHVHHECRVPACVNPEHLDCVDPRTHYQEHHLHGDLTLEQVREIHALNSDTSISRREIAARYGVPEYRVKRIQLGWQWDEETGGAAPLGERFCQFELCGKPLPPTKRRNAKYCDVDCRTRGQRAKTYRPDPTKWKANRDH